MDRRAFLCAGACMAIGIMAGFAGLTQDALARGASADESAKARRLFEQVAPGQGKPVSNPTGTFRLAPGEVLTFECKGYCLDSDLALPSEDEPMAFRPMQRYIAPELRELYVAIMRNVAGGPPEGVRVQQIMYTIRDEASEHHGLLKSEDYRFVNSVLPNGEAVLKKAHRPVEFIGGGGLSLWASKPMPGEREAYSMLTSDGVAGRGIGMGALNVHVTVVNGSPKPFVFDVTQWVLESSRDVQAVGLPVARRYTLTAGRPISTGERSVSKEAPKITRPTQKKQNSQPDDKVFIGY